jgi:hypothetical protein
MTNGGVVGIAHARGEIRYRCRHQTYSLVVNLAHETVLDDGRLRISTNFSANRLRVDVQAHDAVDIEAFALFFDESFRLGERFFLNGYQSWTDSREFSAREHIEPFPPLVRPLLERFFRTNHYGDYDIVPAPVVICMGLLISTNVVFRQERLTFAAPFRKRKGSPFSECWRTSGASSYRRIAMV